MSTKRKRVRVAGGGGFIGSHLCEALLGEGHDVICVDNFFTGNESNIRHLWASTVKLVEGLKKTIEYFQANLTAGEIGSTAT